jgi:hypothetical protein
LIVTTSVRFFESLFSNRPRESGRAHNIARSIIVLDEVQTVPRRLLGPLLGMMPNCLRSFRHTTRTAFAFNGSPGRFPAKSLFTSEPWSAIGPAHRPGGLMDGHLMGTSSRPPFLEVGGGAGGGGRIPAPRRRCSQLFHSAEC